MRTSAQHRQLCLMLSGDLNGKEILKAVDACMCITDLLCFSKKLIHRKASMLQ